MTHRGIASSFLRIFASSRQLTEAKNENGVQTFRFAPRARIYGQIRAFVGHALYVTTARLRHVTLQT